MTDTNTTNAFELADVNLNPNEVIESMGNEIGILSTNVLVGRMKLEAALKALSKANEENANLRLRMANQERDIAAMREQLVDPNHPSQRNKLRKNSKTQ